MPSLENSQKRDLVPEGKLHYDTAGSKENAPLILLHGFMGSSKDWAKVMDALSADYFCVAVDLPGHGKTPPLDDAQHYTLEGAGKMVIETLDQLQIKKCVLLGYSMGGRTALGLALSHPQYFSKVILESATPGIPDAADRAARRAADEKLAEKLKTVPLEKFLADWYEMPLFATLREQPQVLKEVVKRRSDNSSEELARSLRNMGTGSQDSYWDRLPELQTELLILTGERDEKFKGIAEKMIGRSPKVSHQNITGAGHNIHLEAPGEYVRAIRESIEA